MFKVLFGDISNGRLQRLAFLGYIVLLTLLFMAAMFGVVFAFGTGESIIGGDLQQAQDMLRETLGIPFIIIFMAMMMLLFFAQMNLAAKRIRDIGLPGWWVVLLLLLLGGVTSAMMTKEQGGGLHFLVFLLLVLIPSGSFGKSANPD